MERSVETVDHVVIRFAGDSGDGMQLTGSQFSGTTAASHGNDLATFPDYPAEIRAPAGTIAGVSGFQLHFSSRDIYTPGDAPGVLVAMNPAALRANIGDLVPGGTILLNVDKFTDRDLEKADYTTNPLQDGSLDPFNVVEVQMSTLTRNACADLGLSSKEVDRCKNFFALGMTYYLFNRDMTFTREWIESRFQEPYRQANLAAMEAGYSFADTVEAFHSTYEVPRASLPPGTYRNLMGSQAMALGFVAAAQLADRPLFQGAYPITPASDILHHLARYKEFGVVTFQAEDEIAAICATIGAAFAGNIAITSTSGPGLALKGEALGYALIAELPMVVVDVQRGGPSTGLPTKTEQSDLLFAMYGRHGESPLPIVAAESPSDCFTTAVEAVRMAVKYMIPVVMLTDGYLANGAEPWRIPDMDELEPITVTQGGSPDDFQPYGRDPVTLARPWAVPGMAGLEHRVGGLEKDDVTGNVSYVPANHQHMCEQRAERVRRLQADIAPATPWGANSGTLIVSWGSTGGAVRAACERAAELGLSVGHLHLRWLNPFPSNLREVLDRYETIAVPEMNLGQLSHMLRAEFLRDVVSFPKIQGQPFKVTEVLSWIESLVGGAA